MVRTGEPAGHRGYPHEALLYNSDEEFSAVALPFLQDGVAAGSPSGSRRRGSEAVTRFWAPTGWSNCPVATARTRLCAGGSFRPGGTERAK
jgi:hypothetical protein